MKGKDITFLMDGKSKINAECYCKQKGQNEDGCGLIEWTEGLEPRVYYEIQGMDSLEPTLNILMKIQSKDYLACNFLEVEDLHWKRNWSTGIIKSRAIRLYIELKQNIQMSIQKDHLNNMGLKYLQKLSLTKELSWKNYTRSIFIMDTMRKKIKLIEEPTVLTDDNLKRVKTKMPWLTMKIVRRKARKG